MQVVIISGGLGTRLKSMAHNIPKAMVPVAGKPFVSHQIAWLRRQGLTEILMCIGHLGDQIEAHVGDGSQLGVSVRFSKENPNQLLGTGGALMNAYQMLSQEFLMIYGDSYLPTRFDHMIQWSRNSRFPAVMSVYENLDRWDSSNVKIDEERVSFYSKKAPPGLCRYIDYGLSYFQKNVLDGFLSAKLPLDLALIQEQLVSTKQLGAFKVFDRFYEVGKPEGVEELNQYLSSEKAV